MANYVSIGVAYKKRWILEKRIDSLLGALKREESAERLAIAAETVREAQLAVCRCLEDHLDYTPSPGKKDQHERELANIHRRRERWTETEAAEIIRHYARGKPHSAHGLFEPPSSR